MTREQPLNNNTMVNMNMHMSMSLSDIQPIQPVEENRNQNAEIVKINEKLMADNQEMGKQIVTLFRFKEALIVQKVKDEMKFQQEKEKLEDEIWKLKSDNAYLSNRIDQESNSSQLFKGNLLI
jgi:predicted outer membrane protein